MDHLTLLGLSNSAEGDIKTKSSDYRVASGANPARFLLVQLDVCQKLSHFYQNSKMQSYVVFLVYSGHKK